MKYYIQNLIIICSYKYVFIKILFLYGTMKYVIMVTIDSYLLLLCCIWNSIINKIQYVKILEHIIYIRIFTSKYILENTICQDSRTYYIY